MGYYDKVCIIDAEALQQAFSEYHRANNSSDCTCGGGGGGVVSTDDITAFLGGTTKACKISGRDKFVNLVIDDVDTFEPPVCKHFVDFMHENTVDEDKPSAFIEFWELFHR